MKSREKQLAKNTMIVAVGKVLTQSISFLLLPLYTALLSTEEYGMIDLLNTYIMLLIPVVFFQIDQAIFRFLIDARNDEKEKTKIITTSFVTIFLQCVLYLILCVFFIRFIQNDYKYFLVTNVISLMISNLLLQISRGLGDNLTYSIGSLICGLGTVLMNIIFIAGFKWGAYGMLIATFFSNILCGLYVFLKKKIYGYISLREYDKEIIKILWKYSIPLVPNQLSWWIVNVSDRIIIAYMIGVGYNGIYSAANKFSSICIVLFNVFNMTWTESASIHIKDKDSSEFFSNIINSTMRLFVPLGLMIIAFIPFVFKFLITGEQYASAYYQIPILILSTIGTIYVSLFGTVYVALKKSSEIAKTSICAAIINILINIILIKKIGLYAASLSTLISYFTMAIYRGFDIQKYVKIKINKKESFTYVCIISLVLMIYYIQNMYLQAISMLAIMIFAFRINKELINTVYLLLKSKVKKVA